MPYIARGVGLQIGPFYPSQLQDRKLQISWDLAYPIGSYLLVKDYCAVLHNTLIHARASCDVPSWARPPLAARPI
jgi:hypothetical protein